MSKRRLEQIYDPPQKRVRVCRKRGRTEDVFEARKRMCHEMEVFQEVENAFHMCAKDEILALKRENAHLRTVLGKVARLGITLKAERDLLRQQQQYNHVITQHLITVQ